MSNTTERLQSIEQELKNILEARVSELMQSMRQAETLTRRIVSAEAEIAQSRQLRENLEGEIERLRGDVAAMRARVDEIRQANGELWAERDRLRDDLKSAEGEVESAKRELDEGRQRVQELTGQRDALQDETGTMRKKVTALQETSLSSELGGIGAEPRQASDK